MPYETIEKDNLKIFPVAGLTYENRVENYSALNIDDKLILVRDPENPHDKSAIKVETENGEELGYVPKEMAEELAQRLDKKEVFNLTVYAKGGSIGRQAFLLIKISSV